MKLSSLIFSTLFALHGLAPIAAFGEHHEHHEHHGHKAHSASARKIDDQKMVVKVTGMVCSFCAQGIEKKFNARKEVEKTKIDLDKMEVTINFKKGKTLPEATIKKIITDAGFKYVGVK